MALPVWGLFMKKCYANKDLDISKEAFKKPEEMSITTDCDTWKGAGSDIEEIPDEFDF
jgi:penicillin-binding protein 1A